MASSCSSFSSWKPRRHAASVLLLTSALWLAVGIGCYGSSDAVMDPPTPPTPVAVETVAAPTGPDPLVLAGVVQPAARILLPARVSGYASVIEVDLGDAVEAGQLLATLDSPALRREHAAAEARLEIATARSAEAERELKRQNSLLDATSTSTRKQQEARAEFDVRMAELSLARIDAEHTAEQLEDTRLLSPIDGYVESRLIEEHEWIAETEPTFALLDSRAAIVRIDVPAHLAERVDRSSPVEIRTSRAPEDHVIGRVARVGASADADTHAIPFEIEAESTALLPGVIVEVTLPLQRSGPIVEIPIASVFQQDDGGEYCFVVVEGTPNRVARRAIVVAGFQSGSVRILSGLEAGELVVTRGQHYVRDGEAVQIVAN